MLDFFYNLLIVPIEVLVEATYYIMYKLLDNCGLAVIAVSLVIQTIILPLYKRSDAMQEEERQRQKNMEHWVRHIRRTFHGDERVMMLQTYYRQQGYKPWYALKSSASILLQIPFFIAAYHYLSNASALSGSSFLFVRDLGMPDRALTVGPFAVNVLPVIMTVLNIISGMIYTKGLTKRDKLQVYGLAAIFLVLLYNSPSGLVLYWTMNNLYSLLKNVCMKLLAGKVRIPAPKRNGIAGVAAPESGGNVTRQKWCRTYMAEALFCTLFMGALIPLNIVSASPAEFMNGIYGPGTIVFRNVTVYAGIFLVWGTIFILFMEPKVQRFMTAAVFVLSGIFILDYMGFGDSTLSMNAFLVYDGELVFPLKTRLINIFLVIVLAAVLAFVALRCTKIMTRAAWLLAVGTFVMCAVNSAALFRHMEAILDRQEKNAAVGDTMFTLDSSGKNVVVVMLDRAISGYLPFILDEKPELREAFSGFVYYPNTLSFGGYTNFAAPALFGGYEYTPSEINKRKDESLAKKHDEALLVMPRIFSDAGFQVTVCDPPYAGSYDWVQDLSIYDKYENVTAFVAEGLEGDAFGWFEDGSSYAVSQKNAFIYHSMMKVLPTALQWRVYAMGTYCGSSVSPDAKPAWVSYRVMDSLPDKTEISDDGTDQFILFQNSITHDTGLLRLPEYVPDYTPGAEIGFQQEVREVGGQTLTIQTSEQAAHYQCNMAAMLKLADWFEYLKANGCWDNTRIIVASDHGRDLGNFESMLFDNGLDLEMYNPLLMVKDFNADGFAVDGTFMTNADVPSIALQGIVESPVNPFTGNPITNEAKYKPMLMTSSFLYNTEDNRGNVFDTSDAPWYEVTGDNIFDEANWKKAE